MNLYSQFLFVELPEKRSDIQFSTGKTEEWYSVIGAGDLATQIHKLKKLSMFFKMTDNEYYLKLEKECDEFDEYLNKIHSQGIRKDDSAMMEKKIDDHLMLIFALINQKYQGKRVKTKNHR